MDADFSADPRELRERASACSGEPGAGADPQELRERALAFRLVARILSDDEVDVAFLEALRATDAQTGTELDGFVAGLAGADLEQVRIDLAADHAATLLGMAARPVSPYESVYTSEKELMMQEARDEVIAAYAASGFACQAPQGSTAPEDHIATELAFAAALDERAADRLVQAADETDESCRATLLAGAERDLAARDCFAARHLARWVPTFARLLEERAATPFYRGAAQMLLRLVGEPAA